MLGNRIAFLRHNNGLTQAKLARDLNISPSALGMYEQGRRSPPNDILVALAHRFRVSTDYLLTGNVCEQEDYQLLVRLLQENRINSVIPVMFLKEQGTIVLQVGLEKKGAEHL